MPDRIHIRDLSLMTILGVHDRERQAPRKVVLNLAIETDLARAGRSDNLADTVDYGALGRRIAGHVERSRFGLLEGLAQSVAELALEHFPAIEAITVTVEKPGAVEQARSVAVEIRRVGPWAPVRVRSTTSGHPSTAVRSRCPDPAPGSRGR